MFQELGLTNPFGAPVFQRETVSSTMDIARELAAAGEPHGTVITADFQTAGRGRIGRAWHSEGRGNLFFTILLRYASIPAALSLKAGLAISWAIEDFLRSRDPALAEALRVKWPNDIMLGSRKTAGILVEGDGGLGYIGVGVNVAQKTFPEALRKKAVSLALVCETVSAEDRFLLLEKILAGLFKILNSCEAWREDLRERLYMRNQRVRFIPGGTDSTASVEGILQGLGPQGELLLLPLGRDEPVSFVTGELDVYEKS
jgi:BirA family biotin operon repressor/biotin-[acetyl-CoA-carboxylase] ligase